ncbi:MAG: hypothetical protein LUI10_09420 [Lachnospiraceae bacterium]|nr:hypothetical protein [Lachnospiraceae bacterium]
MKRKNVAGRALVIVAFAIVLILFASLWVRRSAEGFSDMPVNVEEESTGSEAVEIETAEKEDAATETTPEVIEEENGGTEETSEAEESGEGETSGESLEMTGEENSEAVSEIQESDLDLSSVTSVLYHEGGGYISDFISGVSYSSVLDWLSLHREDDYYLGTPYPSEPDGTLIGGSSGSTDRRNPNGDCETAYGNDDYDGEAMLNCTGFVWHVFYKASGMSEEEAFNTIPCWGSVGAKDWISYLRNSSLEYKTYYGSADSLETLVAAMIADGYMEPGDIIWTWGEGTVMASDGLPSKSSDPHVGIYTGTYFGGDADEWWHSLGYSTATDTFYGENLYGSITPMAPCVAMTVIKLGSSVTETEGE